MKHIWLRLVPNTVIHTKHFQDKNAMNQTWNIYQYSLVDVEDMRGERKTT
jgi:hypothetical protein